MEQFCWMIYANNNHPSQVSARHWIKLPTFTQALKH